MMAAVVQPSRMQSREVDAVRRVDSESAFGGYGQEIFVGQLIPTLVRCADCVPSHVVEQRYKPVVPGVLVEQEVSLHSLANGVLRGGCGLTGEGFGICGQFCIE